MMNMMVHIDIDVDAETAEAAAKKAWELLTAPGAMLPVCDVFSDNGMDRVDLQELAEKGE